MRGFAKICGLLIIVALKPAKAAQLLSFSCEGTYQDISTKELGQSDKNGVAIDLDGKTVAFAGYVAQLKHVDPAQIRFEGQGRGQLGMIYTFQGSMDRLTGAFLAMVVETYPDLKGSPPQATNWNLLCKPAGRLF